MRGVKRAPCHTCMHATLLSGHINYMLWMATAGSQRGKGSPNLRNRAREVGMPISRKSLLLSNVSFSANQGYYPSRSQSVGRDPSAKQTSVSKNTCIMLHNSSKITVTS